MAERQMGKYCKIFVDALYEMFPKESVKVNNLGPNEGCVVDVKHKAVEKLAERKEYPIQTYSSLSIREDRPKYKYIDGEVMVTHCPTYGKWSEHFLIGMGEQLCDNGCKITMVHTHSGIVPNSHFHVSCNLTKLEEIGNPEHCIRKVAKLLKQADEFTEKTCI